MVGNKKETDYNHRLCKDGGYLLCFAETALLGAFFLFHQETKKRSVNGIMKKSCLSSLSFLVIAGGLFLQHEPATATGRLVSSRLSNTRPLMPPGWFVDLLAEHGYVAGQNVTYQIQNAQGDMATANTMRKNLRKARPNSRNATPTAQAVANLIKDKPILITAVTGPVAAGLVESAARRGPMSPGPMTYSRWMNSSNWPRLCP